LAEPTGLGIGHTGPPGTSVTGARPFNPPIPDREQGTLPKLVLTKTSLCLIKVD